MVERGYLHALLGWLVGGAAFGIAAGALTAVITVSCEDNGDDFRCLGVFLIALAATVLVTFVGALLGCYVALRRWRQPSAGATVGVLASLVIGGVLLGVVIGFQRWAYGGVFIPLVVPALVGAPLAARRIVLSLVTGRESKSDDPSDIVGSPPL